MIEVLHIGSMVEVKFMLTRYSQAEVFFRVVNVDFVTKQEPQLRIKGLCPKYNSNSSKQGAS